jgi:hypothetical protein
MNASADLLRPFAIARVVRFGLFGRLVSYLFSFNPVFSFKVFGIFALVCDKNCNRYKAWERKAMS